MVIGGRMLYLVCGAIASQTKAQEAFIISYVNFFNFINLQWLCCISLAL